MDSAEKSQRLHTRTQHTWHRSRESRAHGSHLMAPQRVHARVSTPGFEGPPAPSLAQWRGIQTAAAWSVSGWKRRMLISCPTDFGFGGQHRWQMRTQQSAQVGRAPVVRPPTHILRKPLLVNRDRDRASPRCHGECIGQRHPLSCCCSPPASSSLTVRSMGASPAAGRVRAIRSRVSVKPTSRSLADGGTRRAGAGVGESA